MKSKSSFIVAVIGIALAASLGTYTAIKLTAPQQQETPRQPLLPPQVPSLPHTHVGVIFENERYTPGGYFPDNEIKLYDFDSNNTTVIKEFANDIQTNKTLEGWAMPDGQPIIILDKHDIDASHTKLSLFEPAAGKLNQTIIKRSEIVSPYVSMAFLPSQKLVSYCGPEGEYIVENIESGMRTMPNNNVPLCQVAYNASQPHFSANGSAIYFNDLPVPETGAEKNYLIYKKLDLATGIISDVSSLANTFHNYSNLSMNPRHSLFLETLQNGFRVRDIHTLDIEHSETTEIATMPIVTEVVLAPPGGNVTIGKGVFTQDGKGLFYYTLIGSSDPSNVNNEPTRFALGYLDLQTHTNTYPISLPDSDNQDTHFFQGVQIFDAFDNNSLLYAVTKIPFRTTSTGDFTTQSQGVSKLYARSSNGTTHLIDTSSYLFETISFVVMH